MTTTGKKGEGMHLGNVVYSTDETLERIPPWGCLHCTGGFCQVFLLGKGVECEKHDAEPFNVRKHNAGLSQCKGNHYRVFVAHA